MTGQKRIVDTVECIPHHCTLLAISSVDIAKMVVADLTSPHLTSPRPRTPPPGASNTVQTTRVRKYAGNKRVSGNLRKNGTAQRYYTKRAGTNTKGAEPKDTCHPFTKGAYQAPQQAH
jgi:hypothetical protein